MRRPSIALGALAGGLCALALVALFDFGSRVAGFPFVPFDLFDRLARILPGVVVRRGIETIVGAIVLLGAGPIGSVAKAVEHAMAVGIVLAAGIVAGIVLSRVPRRSRWFGRPSGALAGALGFLITLAVERGAAHGFFLLWLVLLLVGWGLGVGILIEAATRKRAVLVPVLPQPDPEPAVAVDRRTVLLRGAALLVSLSAVAWIAGRIFQRGAAQTGAGLPLGGIPQPPAGGPGGTAAGESSGTGAALAEGPVPGTRAPITPTSAFYRVDIDASPPRIEGGSWKLSAQGLFGKPRDLSLADLRAYPAVTARITQCCISNPVGGDLIGTTLYTGLRLRPLLEDLGLRPEASALAIRSADEFYETVPMAALLDPRVLLVYGMNGETLPAEHGFPLRIYLPNHYGMKQPKWITSVEAVDHDTSGYWVDRGWSREAVPHVLSVIDVVGPLTQGQVPVGGIAWAGDRGISRVEVQVDDGPWAEARLLNPEFNPLAWVLWRYDWPARGGRHTFRVRATDGTGAVQNATSRPTFPDGAAGLHERTARIRV